MAKNQNTFEKRKREMEKKLKAAAKRERRKKRKEQAGQPTEIEQPGVVGDLGENEPEADEP